MSYINLRTHSHFSLQLGIGTIKDYLAAIKKKNNAGLCLTDNHSMAGVLQAYTECKSSKTPFVAGSNLYITEDISTYNQFNKYHRQLVLIKNTNGYKGLCKAISNSSNKDHFYYKPRVSIDELFKMAGNIIVTTSCANSIFSNYYLSDDSLMNLNADEEMFLKYKSIFGDDFYGEILLNNLDYEWSKDLKAFVPQDEDKQIKINKRIIELCKKHNVKLVATFPTYIPDVNHYSVQTTTIKNSPGNDGWHFHEPLYLHNEVELRNRAKNRHSYISEEILNEAIKNTIEIMNKCSGLTLNFKPILPQINYNEHVAKNDINTINKLEEISKSCSEDETFLKLLETSKLDDSLDLTIKIIIYNNKINLLDKRIRDRISYELKVIQRNGVIKLCDYFLLLEDINRYVVDGIEFGIRNFGRGSGASSLLNYALDITDVNPLQYDLPFERFMTLERIGRFSFDLGGEHA